MAFNGSGVFVRVRNWATDKLNSLNPTATRYDEHDDDVANALSNCICKDGQTSVTANISLNAHKLTNITNATNGTDALNLQTGDGRYAQITASNTLTGTLTLSGTVPMLRWNETDGPADEKNWRAYADVGQLNWQTLDDAFLNPVTFFSISRTGTTVDAIGFQTTALTLNGVAVLTDTGTFNNARISQANVTQHQAALSINCEQLVTDYTDSALTSLTLGSGHQEGIIRFTSASAVTVTLPGSTPSGWAIGDTVVIIRGGTGTVTFSGGTQHSPGGSTILVQNGVAAITLIASGVWQLSGNV